MYFAAEFTDGVNSHIDDFVLLSIFVGNDFMKPLPHFSIKEGSLDVVMGTYAQLVKDGLSLVENGEVIIFLTNQCFVFFTTCSSYSIFCWFLVLLFEFYIFAGLYCVGVVHTRNQFYLLSNRNTDKYSKSVRTTEEFSSLGED